MPAATPVISPPEKINLFEEKTDGFVSYRIPGIVVTAKGTVLVYCEARKFTGQDWGEIEVHAQRSADGGKTFEPVRQIAHTGPRLPRNPVATDKKSKKSVGGPTEQTVNNPVMIADRDGTVHFIYCVEYMRSFYRRSEDDGVTWSEPREITSAFEEFRAKWPWRVIATGPGHAIQLKTGRLVVPVWVAKSEAAAHANAIGSTIYSDDQGQTWHAGEIAVPNDQHTPGTSENIAVELSDGRVMLNVRTRALANRRVVSFSKDGATGWTKPEFVPELLEPVCMAGLVRHPGTRSSPQPFLLFSNPDSLDRADGKGVPGERRDRKNVTVKASYDDGRTWPVSRLLQNGPSAYSDLAVLPDGTILCFYENGGENAKTSWPYKYLTLARLSPEWLTHNP
ncbi:sialidase family protein [Oleiharenicola lentus]|uniref:sialidase family protein n=1 Tax=Oleiharenicola lentus TaxID=2508720 RepID=UPI003F670970